MREIKFRAWNLDREEWAVYGVMDMNGNFNQEGVESHGYRYVIQLYIGLKDKNGVEIYEGDIVRNIGYLHPAEVIYEAPSFMVGENGMLRDIDLNLYDRLEVIGNIYENPNLLSQDK